MSGTNLILRLNPGDSASNIDETLAPFIEQFISKRISPLYDYYQVISRTDSDTGEIIISFYDINGVELVAMEIKKIGASTLLPGASWEISIRKTFILTENDFNLLLEDGARIIS